MGRDPAETARERHKQQEKELETGQKKRKEEVSTHASYHLRRCLKQSEATKMGKSLGGMPPRKTLSPFWRRCVAALFCQMN